MAVQRSTISRSTRKTISERSEDHCPPARIPTAGQYGSRRPLDYSKLIGEEYEKKRKAVLEYTRNDVVHTTAILDVDMEQELFGYYYIWLVEQFQAAEDTHDEGVRRFFLELQNEMGRDHQEVVREHHKLGERIYRMEDGEWTVRSLRQKRPLVIQWDPLPRTSGAQPITTDDTEPETKWAGHAPSPLAPSEDIDTVPVTDPSQTFHEPELERPNGEDYTGTEVRTTMLSPLHLHSICSPCDDK